MKDKVVIITGAASGIGLATARKFASNGTRVVMADINKESLTVHSDTLLAGGHDILPVVADVSIEQDCLNLIKKAVDRYGRIDVLVNNAGLSMRALFSELDLKVIKRLMDVNFMGAVYCTKFALPYILEAGGSVVGITSVAGIQGLPGRTGYSSSKFALWGFLETLRLENLKSNLHVLILAPGFTSTNVRKSALLADGTPQGTSPRNEGKMMTPEQVARHIVRGVKKRKRLVILSVAGRLTMLCKGLFPRFVDKTYYTYMAKEPDSPFQ